MKVNSPMDVSKHVMKPKFQIFLDIKIGAWGPPLIQACTDRSNENGTLTNKPYWNEGTLNGDKIH